MMISGDISKDTFLNALSNLDIHLHQNFIDGLNECIKNYKFNNN